jgi:hypothetical protein
MGRPIGRQVVTVHSHFMGNLGIRHITWRNLMNMTFCEPPIEPRIPGFRRAASLKRAPDNPKSQRPFL